MPPNQNQPGQNQVPPISQPPPGNYGTGGQAPLGGAQMREQPPNGIAVAGFILIMASVVLFWLPFINFILWLVGLILSIIGLVNANKGAKNKGLALAGIIVAAVAAVISLIAIAVVFSNPELIEEFEEQQQEESQTIDDAQP